MTVREIHLVSHTHTDFGFTDYPETLMRHHNRIIDRAIDTCEAEAHRDDAAQFRWTCEVATVTERWLRQASSADVDRFLALHRSGHMGAGGMFAHWTPLLTPANAARSMRTVARLRRDYGLDVGVAWQCDVNGLSWPWVDLLIDMGMTGLVLAPNPHRGMPFETQQRMFNWQAPSGRVLPTLHGWHYSVGAWGFHLGDDDMAKTQGAVDRMLGALEARGGYEHETILCEVTNPAAIDNGFPTNVSDFVARWNAERRSPALRLSTLDQAFDALLADPAMAAAPTWEGDFTDYWADGIGSTAYETGLAREAERHLPALELLGALREGGEPALLEEAAEALRFYDEHTWGSFCSVIVPDSPFTRANLSWKTARAHEGFSLVHEVLAEEARGLARDRTGGPVENDIPIRRGTEGPTRIEDQSYWILNPSSRPLSVRWPVTWDYGGAAPQTILHGYLSDHYRRDMKVDRPGFDHSQTHILSIDLPPFAEAVVRPVPAALSGEVGPDRIETGAMRLVVDPRDGSLAALVRKSDGRDWVGEGAALGRLVYESLADPAKGRASIFGETGEWQYDWTRLETIAWPGSRPDLVRRAASTVEIAPARQTLFGPEIEVRLGWDHGDRAVLTYRLPPEGETVEMRVTIEKVAVEDPESMHLSFAIPGTAPRFEADLGEQSATLEREQVPDACRAWVVAQKYAAVETDRAALTVAAPDAPLVQPGGPQTDRATAPDLTTPELAFWLFNNHWDVNFAAAQEARRLSYRFALDLSDGFDPVRARAHAEAAVTRPVIVRAYDAAPRDPARVLHVSDETLDLRLRRAMDGTNLVLAVSNPYAAQRTLDLSLPDCAIAGARPVSVTEDPLGDDAPAVGGTVTLTLPARSSRSYLLRLAPD